VDAYWFLIIRARAFFFFLQESKAKKICKTLKKNMLQIENRRGEREGKKRRQGKEMEA
jgi:hypothetical protein